MTVSKTTLGDEMRLQRRLLLYLVIPALLVGAVGAVGISSLYRLAGAANDILSDNYRSIQEARKMERALRMIERAWTSREAYSHLLEGVEEAAEAFEAALRHSEANITEEGETDILSDVRRQWVQMAPYLESTGLSDREATNRAIAQTLSIFRRIDELIDMNERAMFSHERRTVHSARWAVGLMGASLLAAMITLSIFARIAAGRISRPILAVADNLHNTLKDKTLAGTELTHTADEIERLGVELANLLERLALYEDEQAGEFLRLQGRLAFVMGEVQEGLILINHKLDILDLNESGQRILGPGVATGQNLRDVQLEEQVRTALSPVFTEELRSQTELEEVRCEMEGETRVYRPRILPVTPSAGSMEGYLLVFWDVTKEQRFEESRRHFIAMLSHQLKTPVTSLTMSVNLLWEQFHGRASEADELLAMAKEDCAALSSLIGELVGAARDTAPELRLRVRRVNVAGLLREALRPFFPQANDKGITLRDELGSLPVTMDADPVKLPWVITNLVGNAFRYTPSGGVVTVALHTAGEHVEVVVSDTGAGIAPESVERLFLPSASPKDSARPGLHGLGLVIAREIIEAHHGSISVDTELDRGTTFTIRFPMVMGEGQ